MAGIFNLFGGLSEHDRGQLMKPLARSKSALGLSGPSGKTISQAKPKGLSIRSNSDLNIPVTPCASGSKGDAYNMKKELLKPKLSQVDNVIRPISPKKLNIQPLKMREQSPKNEMTEKEPMKTQKPFEECIFKKPLPPKKFVKKTYPEPEGLAPYYDMQSDFDNIYSKTLENELKELVRKKIEEQTYEDEGFESDPEQFDLEILNLALSPEILDNEQQKVWTPDLPDISDDDDDDDTY